ncbi:MAG TPA: tetratricopeptide repeat protein [Flavobacterium sp.]
MNLTDYTYLLNHPDAVTDKRTQALDKIVHEFPYFQSARALRLKGLYNQNSFQYNYALKVAAAYTTDRSVLFDFITSDSFTVIQKGLYDEKQEEIYTIDVKGGEVLGQDTSITPEEKIQQSILTSIKESSKPYVNDADYIFIDPDTPELADTEVEAEDQYEPPATEVVNEQEEEIALRENEVHVEAQIQTDEDSDTEILAYANETLITDKGIETEIEFQSEDEVDVEVKAGDETVQLKVDNEEHIAVLPDEPTVEIPEETVEEVEVEEEEEIPAAENDVAQIIEPTEIREPEIIAEEISEVEFAPEDAVILEEVESTSVELEPKVTSQANDSFGERIEELILPIRVHVPEPLERVDEEIHVPIIPPTIQPEEIKPEEVIPDTTEDDKIQIPIIELSKSSIEFVPVTAAPAIPEIGKPLEFSKDEKHSFREWLHLSSMKPIIRDEEIKEETGNVERKKKTDLIDRFIRTSPRISPVKDFKPAEPVEVYREDNSALMTETLARVYLEQKKYGKAIQAYEILILKYPEKSIFFADRISEIKKLQQNS